MRTAPTLLRAALLGTLAIVLTGCATYRQSFPGHQPEVVWTAMKAVAEAPEYRDWHVSHNAVWEDPEAARLEVHRELRRTEARPRARRWGQQRQWRFQIVLEEEDPPTARFISRSPGVPMHARDEAQRYFADVWSMLRAGS